MGVALRDLDFDQWEWKEELKVLGLEDVSFGEYLKILICINITLKVLILSYLRFHTTCFGTSPFIVRNELTSTAKFL